MDKVRREAMVVAGAMGLAGALLLVGYDAARVTATEQLAATYGEGADAWLLAAMPLGVLAAIWGAGALLSRLGPRRTLRATAAIAAGALAVCTLGMRWGFAPAVLGFAFVREVYVVLLIEQLWSFLDSVLSGQEARTLNGPITGIGSVGALIGAIVVYPLSGVVGPENVPWLSIATVGLAALVADRAYGRVPEPQPGPEEATRRGQMGWGPLLRSRTLLLLLGIVLVTRVLSATVSLGFEGAVATAFPDPTQADRYQDGVYGHLSILMAILQFIAAPLLLRNLPKGLVWVGMPAVQLLAAGSMLLAPSPLSGALCLVTFRSFEYSLFRDTKELFYQPLSFEARFRTKLLLDVLGHRLGKGLLALFLGAPVLANTRLVALSPALSVGACVVWLVLAVGMARGERGS